MKRYSLIFGACLLALSACGGSAGSDPSTGVADGSGSPTGASADTAPGGDSTAGADSGGDSTADTQPTSGPAYPSLEEVLLAVEGTPPTDAALGLPDHNAAATIAGALFSEIDATGLDVWVFPVIGSDEVLLVLEIDGDAVDEDAEATDFDLLQFLASHPSVVDAGVTRFVANLHAVDEQGEVVLTTTMSMAAVREAAANNTDLADGDFVFQVLRDGVAQ